MHSAWSSTVDDFQLWRNDASGSVKSNSISLIPSLQSRTSQLPGQQHTMPRSYAQTSSSDAQAESSRVPASAHTFGQNQDSVHIFASEREYEHTAGHFYTNGTNAKAKFDEQSIGPRHFGFEADVLQKTCPSKSIIVPYEAPQAAKSNQSKANRSNGYWRGKNRPYAAQRKYQQSKGGSSSANGKAHSTKKGNRKASARPLQGEGMTPARVLCEKRAGSNQSTLLLEAIEDVDGIETISIRRGDTVYRRLEDLDPESMQDLTTKSPKSTFDHCAPKPLFLGGSVTNAGGSSSEGVIPLGDSTDRRIEKYGPLFQRNEEEAQRRMSQQTESFRPEIEGWSTLTRIPNERRSKHGHSKQGDQNKDTIPALGAASRQQDGKLGSIRLGLKSIPLLESYDYDRQASESRSNSSFLTLQPARVPLVDQWLKNTAYGGHPTQGYAQTDHLYNSAIGTSECPSEVSWNDPEDVYGHSEIDG